MSEIRIKNLMGLNETMTPRDYAVRQLSYIDEIERLRAELDLSRRLYREVIDANATLSEEVLQKDIRIEGLERDCDEHVGLLAEVMDLISESRGVCGYHLNGNEAEWGEFELVDGVRRALDGEE